MTAGQEAALDSPPAFDVIAPLGATRPIIVHVPHASTLIPPDVRAELLVDDAEVDDELLRLTDWHTDDLFGGLRQQGATLFVNGRSRLVFDPERFLDDAREPAAARGQGVVYTLGTRGQRLRHDSWQLRQRRIAAMYEPYHAALGRLVGELLGSDGRCLLLDGHSFPTEPLPSELDQSEGRPDICIGTDAYHTPPALAEALAAAFSGEGLRVERNRPYAGAFVPGGYHRRDARVSSVMIEVRRGLYLDETSAQRRGDYEHVRRAIERAIERALRSVGLRGDQDARPAP